MDGRKEPYIEQQASEDSLYTKLVRQTLEETQRLSGKVWTDYNAHDPGVTLAETAAYALAELDYKLGFPLADCLSEEGRPFDAARFGLFPPTGVYTTSPVTEDDYRRMLLANVPGIDNATVCCDPGTGGYTLRLIPSPFTERTDDEIVSLATAAFHSRRGLCEWLQKVEAAHPDTLDFEAEIEIVPGADATEVLARLYDRILRYLGGDVDVLAPDTFYAGGTSPETWLEGSEDALRTVFSGNAATEHELYGILRGMEGVGRFRTCYLTRDGIPQTRLSGYSLRIPKEEKDFARIKLFRGKETCKIDSDRFLERLKGHCLMHGNASAGRTEGKDAAWTVPTGTWRDLFRHYPIACDLPDCYRLTPDKEQASAFETYTRLSDWIIQNGLAELKALPRLLSLDEEDGDAPQNRDQLRLKSRYLDFLDALYGVESHPAWLSEENSYGETPAGTVRRRTTFLRDIAPLQKERARARNLQAADGDSPTIKRHFCLLLGLDPDDGHTVSNVLPTHNLRLLERKKEEENRRQPGIADRIDSLLIGDRMLRPENVLPVEFVLLSKDEDGRRREYAEMRAALPFFNENLITGDLFRGGTRLDSYKIVKTDENTYMLVYRHREHGGWTNLGQGEDPKALERMANILRRFLREMNRKCETLYVVEPVLADTDRAFEVILVLPSWTHRFHNTRFRSKCLELLRSLLPAHLAGKVHWLGEKEMRQFEICYHQLMRTFTDSRLADYRGKLLEAIDELMTKAGETQDLDDTD